MMIQPMDRIVKKDLYPFKCEQYVDEGINICGGLIIMPQRIEWESCVHWPAVQGYEDYLLEDGDIVMALFLVYETSRQIKSCSAESLG